MQPVERANQRAADLYRLAFRARRPARNAARMQGSTSTAVKSYVLPSEVQHA